MTSEGQIEYFVVKQAFINAEIWVTKLTAEDPIYVYSTEAEAQAKCDELAIEDPTRRFKVSAV
jgi:hypothetical protein